MTIRQKTILSIALTLAVLFAVVIAASQRMLMAGFLRLEEQFVDRSADRLHAGIEDIVDLLRAMTGDWAHWDETYAYAQGLNHQYPDGNLTDLAIGNLALNLVLIYNAEDQLIYGTGFDLDEGRMEPLPDGLDTLLRQDRSFLVYDPEKPDAFLVGFVVLNGQALLIGARPVLNNHQEGPTVGTLIFGRYVNHSFEDRLERFLRYPIAIDLLNTDKMDHDIRAAHDVLREEGGVHIVRSGSERLNGFVLLNDYKNEPALMARFSMPREIYAEGRQSVLKLMIGLLIFGIVLGAVVLIGAHRVVLSRLSALAANAEEIRTRPQFAERLQDVHGNDEITALGQTLNAMLDAVRQFQTALANEKEQLAVTLRSIGDGVITTNRDGEVRLLNKVAETLTGWTQEEAIGRTLNEVFHIINESTRIRCDNPVERVLETGGVVGLVNHTILIARDGREHVIADSGAPIRDRNNHVIGVVLVFRDITDARRIEEERLRANKLESIGLLAGGIAHDFNNILTAIMANLSFARLQCSDQTELNSLLGEAEAASHRARGLTQQLLTFSKGGAPIKKLMPLNDLVRASTDFAVRGSAVRCEFDLAEDLLPAEVDEGQLAQVLHNLVVNAVEAMPQGGTVQVSTRNAKPDGQWRVPTEQDMRFVCIEIQDCGVGIPQQHLTHVFDPYFSTKHRGSGLGLATSHSIVHKHGGHLFVRSVIGQGSTFSIYLPATQATVPLSHKGKNSLIPGRGHILIMDDEHALLLVAKRMLEHAGYRVDIAHDGMQALQQYRECIASDSRYDAVILDLTIPGGMGGLDTLKELAALDPQVKAIVASGYSNDPVLSSYQQYGFLGMLVKPYDIAQLTATLRETIESAH